MSSALTKYIYHPYRSQVFTTTNVDTFHIYFQYLVHMSYDVTNYFDNDFQDHIDLFDISNRALERYASVHPRIMPYMKIDIEKKILYPAEYKYLSYRGLKELMGVQRHIPTPQKTFLADGFLLERDNNHIIDSIIGICDEQLPKYKQYNTAALSFIANNKNHIMDILSEENANAKAK